MTEVNAAKIRLRFLDVLLKLLLPLSFIALKLLGSFIDFMLALGLVNLTANPFLIMDHVLKVELQFTKKKVNSEDAGATVLSAPDATPIEMEEQFQNATLFDKVQQQVQKQVIAAAAAAAELKAAFVDALGESLVESFNFRTCVEPTLTFLSSRNEYKIRYTSLTADTSQAPLIHLTLSQMVHSID